MECQYIVDIVWFQLLAYLSRSYIETIKRKVSERDNSIYVDLTKLSELMCP